MTITSTTAKSYFETGDKPTEVQFGDTIDLISERVAYVSTIAQLSALSTAKAADTPIVYVAGQVSANDPGQGMFYLDPTSTVSADGGTVFKVGSGRAIRLKDGAATNVAWHGAVGDGVTDDSAAFQSAIDSGVDIIVIPLPADKYIVEDIVVRTNISLVCPGGWWDTGAELFCNTAGTSGSPKAIFKMSGETNNINFSGLRFNTDKEWVFGVYNTDTANYLANCLFENCDFRAELTRGVSANLILTDFNRCRFGEIGTPPAATHQAVRSEPASAGQTKSTNAVRFLGCNIYQANAVDGAVYAEWGNEWVFKDTDFELISGRAATLAGIQNVRFEGCWFETVSATSMFNAIQDSNANQGTRPIVYEGCFFNAESTLDHVVTLAGACEASFFDNTFVRAPADFVATVKFGADNSGLTDHRGNITGSGIDPFPSLRKLNAVSLIRGIEHSPEVRDITPMTRTAFVTAEWSEISTTTAVSAVASEMKDFGNALGYRPDGDGSGSYYNATARMLQFLRGKQITWSALGYGDGSGNSTEFKVAIWDSEASPTFSNQTTAAAVGIDTGASAATTTSVNYTVGTAATSLRFGFKAGGVAGTPLVKIETVELVLGVYSSAPSSPSFQ